MSALDKLGGLAGTDKHSSAHEYLGLYDFFFARLRDEPITVLEMGVADGKSLRVWRSYFSQARIVGFDNDLKAREFPVGDRIKTIRGDQSHEDDLKRLISEYAPFGIIIDDAGHEPANQLLAFRTLFPHLMKGGIYCIEDIGVLHPWEDRSVGAFFADLAEKLAYAPIDYRRYSEGEKSSEGVDPFILQWAPKIASLTFAQKLAITVMR